LEGPLFLHKPRKKKKEGNHPLERLSKKKDTITLHYAGGKTRKRARKRRTSRNFGKEGKKRGGGRRGDVRIEEERICRTWKN